jgi:hypothetical protein
MPRRRKRGTPSLGEGEARVSVVRLEEQRELLRRRLERLRPLAGASRGYRTARALLGSKYQRANLVARAAILQAANFVISLLEMTPPL